MDWSLMFCYNQNSVAAADIVSILLMTEARTLNTIVRATRVGVSRRQHRPLGDRVGSTHPTARANATRVAISVRFVVPTHAPEASN